MTRKPLVVFDFDGVIIDGIPEYWRSSRKACLKLLESKLDNFQLPNDVPQEFKYLRPWVKHGWEMVLLAAEFLRPNSSLLKKGFKNFAKDYHRNCNESLEIWEWSPKQLQEALDNVRRESIANDFHKWINSHQVFPGISERLKNFKLEGIEIVVLTTKNADFTNQLLNSFAIKADLLYGYQSGSKTSVLIELSKKRRIEGFIEDRRTTLEEVINTPEIASIPCFLASWGYLKPNDCKDLPTGIFLLEPRTFEQPLANWN